MDHRRARVERPAGPDPSDPDDHVDTDRVLTVPNVLSLVRLGMVPLFVWLFVSEREDLAVAIYAGAAATDFFDGYIARRTGTISELGRLLDPLADRVLIVALVVALVGRDTLSMWLAAAIVLRDVAVLAAWPYLEKRGVARIRVNMTGKTATAALLFGLTWLAISETGFFLAGVGEELGLGFTVMGAALYWVAGAMYGREAMRKLREG